MIKALGKLIWEDTTARVKQNFTPQQQKVCEGMVSYNLHFLCDKCNDRHPIASLSFDLQEGNAVVTYVTPYVITMAYHSDSLDLIKEEIVAFFSDLTGYTFDIKEEKLDNALQTHH